MTSWTSTLHSPPSRARDRWASVDSSRTIMHRALSSRSTASVVARVVAAAERARGGAPAPQPARLAQKRLTPRLRGSLSAVRAASATVGAPSNTNEATKPLAWKAAIDFKYVRDNAAAVQSRSRRMALRLLVVNFGRDFAGRKVACWSWSWSWWRRGTAATTNGW